MTDLHFRSAKQLASDIRRRKVGCLEALDAFLARVDRFNPKLNAIVVTDVDGARRRARQADAALKKGKVWGPLHGVPMTIKESYDVAGLPTTWGLPALKDNIAPRNALAVDRLLAAGVVLFGKTNVPAWLADYQSYNDVYGTTNNPWDLSRSPGGSSGGSAAALAAGFVPLEFGSDIGGSLRAPAHFCLLAQAESRPSAPAWLRPTADAGNTGARRSRRDRADGAQRRRSGPRIIDCRRTGRIDRGDRLQARAAAAAARQAGGLSRPGYRQAPALSHGRKHYHGAEQAGRSPSQARSSGRA